MATRVAAPAYRAAKLIIRLAHGIAEAIAGDPRARDQRRVVFVPDFNVETAQRIYPAADLSEQTSTAGMEASGTGNMKFTLNGAHLIVPPAQSDRALDETVLPVRGHAVVLDLRAGGLPDVDARADG